MDHVLSDKGWKKSDQQFDPTKIGFYLSDKIRGETMYSIASASVTIEKTRDTGLGTLPGFYSQCTPKWWSVSLISKRSRT